MSQLLMWVAFVTIVNNSFDHQLPTKRVLDLPTTVKDPEKQTVTPQTVASPFRLMSLSKDRKLRTYLPAVDDQDTQQILDDPALILYSDAEIPPAYQDWASGLPGIHSPSYNISADDGEPFGNGNLEFPWGRPGGTHRTRNVSTFRFIFLPRDAKGKTWPIIWLRKQLSYSGARGYVWRFPIGTVVGEVLRLRAPNGKLCTFELRTRIRENDDWAVNVFRPFPTSQHLADRIKQLRTDWENCEKLLRLVNHLESTKPMRMGTLVDRNHSRQVFHQSMGVDELPPVGDDTLIVQLLSETTFQTALGDVWRSDKNGLETCAPTTKAPFHIVPADYDAGFIEVDRDSCTRCHETVNHHVDRFNFGREWYGRIRGSDGIFSFHPFSRESVSFNGVRQGVSMNAKLVSAGVLERYNRNKHPLDVYQRIPHLRE